MRYTFTNEISKNCFGVPEAVFEMWELTGFLWNKKRVSRGLARLQYEEVNKNYQHLLTEERLPGHSAYHPERIDIEEFRRALARLERSV